MATAAAQEAAEEEEAVSRRAMTRQTRYSRAHCFDWCGLPREIKALILHFASVLDWKRSMSSLGMHDEPLQIEVMDQQTLEHLSTVNKELKQLTASYRWRQAGDFHAADGGFSEAGDVVLERFRDRVLPQHADKVKTSRFIENSDRRLRSRMLSTFLEQLHDIELLEIDVNDRAPLPMDAVLAVRSRQSCRDSYTQHIMRHKNLTSINLEGIRGDFDETLSQPWVASLLQQLPLLNTVKLRDMGPPDNVDLLPDVLGSLSSLRVLQVASSPITAKWASARLRSPIVFLNILFTADASEDLPLKVIEDFIQLNGSQLKVLVLDSYQIRSPGHLGHGIVAADDPELKPLNLPTLESLQLGRCDAGIRFFDRFSGTPVKTLHLAGEGPALPAFSRMIKARQLPKLADLTVCVYADDPVIKFHKVCFDAGIRLHEDGWNPIPRPEDQQDSNWG